MEKSNELKCPKCGSDKIVKSGKYRRRRGIVQRYRCNICGTSFCHDGYFRSRFPLEVVQYAVQLYIDGSSSEKISDDLKNKYGIVVSRTSICEWIRKAKVPLRSKSSGDQKHKTVREIVELGFLVSVSYVSSQQPRKLLVLQNDMDLI